VPRGLKLREVDGDSARRYGTHSIDRCAEFGCTPNVQAAPEAAGSHPHQGGA